MRLGQLARKYDVSLQEIITYLEKNNASPDKIHPNSSLNEEAEALISDHFSSKLIEIPEVEEELILEDPVIEEILKEELIGGSPVIVEGIKEESTENAEKPITEKPIVEESIVTEPKAEEEIISETVMSIQDEEIEAADIEIEETIEEKEVVKPENAEEVIETDQLLALIESEDPNFDFGKIKLIKAPKKKLEGLKVVGKIDLPEPKIKKEIEPKEELIVEKEVEEISEVITQEDIEREQRKEKRKLYREKQESRRLIAKEKQEALKIRQEKRRQEKEIEDKRAKKEAHYKRKLAINKPGKDISKSKKRRQVIVEESEQEPRPNTIMGRFWKWLNT